jgi:sulfur relay protein TusB/DsrH
MVFFFAQKERYGAFCGRVYVLDEDIRLRGIKDEELVKDVKKITYDDLIDLIVEEDKVVGMF